MIKNNIFFGIVNYKIVASVETMDGFDYAFYLYENDRVVEKTSYTSEGKIKFTRVPQGCEYKLKVFFRSRNKIVSTERILLPRISSKEGIINRSSLIRIFPIDLYYIFHKIESSLSDDKKTEFLDANYYFINNHHPKKTLDRYTQYGVIVDRLMLYHDSGLLDAMKLTYSDCLTLSHVFYSFHMLSVANIYRRRSFTVLKNDIDQREDNINANIFGLVEDGCYLEAREILAEARNLGFIQIKTFRKIDFYIQLMSGESFDQKLRDYLIAIKCNEDFLRFSDYLSGKSVAVVGPAETDVFSGEEIDSFDVVIRTNYKFREIQPSPEKYGKKTNISYYNGGDPKTFFAEIKEVIGSLDCAVFKNEKTKNIFDGLAKTRIMTRNSMFYMGTANGVQNIIYELILCRPKRIKVYSSNLFMDANSYNHLYRSGHRITGRNWVCHDPVSNFIFMNRLYENSLFEADATTDLVLGLSPAEYIFRLNQIYGI